MTVSTSDLGAARVIVWDRQARRNAWDLATMTEIADAALAALTAAAQAADGHASIGIMATWPSGDSRAVSKIAMKRASTKPSVHAAVQWCRP